MPGCRRSLFFVAPRQVAVREEPLSAPGPGEVLVETMLSAISPGTEMLVYRGQVPREMPLDASIPGLGDTFAFPVKYGYAAVGRVAELGAGVDKQWEDRLVLCLLPHESHFVSAAEDLLPVPPGVSAEDACFFPNVETAVTLLMDGQPIVGEDVAVVGQGVVGLLTTALLAGLPLASLVTLDHHATRRARSLELGAHRCLDPAADDLQTLRGSFDLTYELSGNPDALDAAVALTGFGGRVVIGSWYGDRRVSLDLGGAFHRSRMHLVSSQVSTIDPRWAGRWDKARRRDVAWRLLAELGPSRLVTHRVSFDDAAAAYKLVDERPDEAVQVLLTYDR
jgi:2-desacetyl-2-hydroxyethyl bacteriochlorophyllide A dehydrogenase